MGDHVDNPVLEALERTWCADADIEFVVVFGSRVHGETHPGSDLDIAVKFGDHLDSLERFRRRCHLSGTLQRADAPFVDVADLDELPLEVAHDAIQGEFLCGNQSAFRSVARAIETAYDEQRETLTEHHQSVIDRIATEGLRG